MAINLNPGADATLVSVAYRAAMANTPADYSDTLERAADSYEKTMEASSEMWGNVAKIGAKLGGEMVANANERAAYAAKTSTLNPEDAEVLLSELYGIKDAQKELGFLPGVFGSRETKMELAKLKMDQQELFADIDLTAASLKAGTNAVASGAFDTKLAMGEGEIVNAIIKSGLKNRVTGNGNVAKLGRDEYGELAWTLYRENGELADNPNGTNEPVIMNIKQFNKSLATNVDDKGAMASGFEKKNTQIADRGLKSRTGVYDEQMRAMDSNWLDTQLGDKPINLKRAMHMKFGYMKTSFFDDITTNQNEYSADLYNTLVSVTGGKGALSGVIVDGMKDTDGEEGISAQEAMDSDNYQVLTANLLGMKDPEVSKAYFKDYVLKEFEGANNYGHGNKPPVAGKTDETDAASLNPFSKGGGSRITNNDGKSIYVANTERNNRRRSVMDIVDNKSGAGTRFVGTLGDYNWDKETGLWMSGDNTYETVDLMRDERLYFAGGKFEGGLGTSTTEQVVVKGTESSFASTINMSFMDKDDNDIATSLQSMMPSAFSGENPNGYQFKNLRSILVDDFTAEAVGLYDDDENIVRYPEGHPKEGDKVIIYTGGNKERRMTAISTLDDILNTEQFKIKGFGGDTGGKADALINQYKPR